MEKIKKALPAVIAVIVVLAVIFIFGGDKLGVDNSMFSSGTEKEFRFSVVRFHGEIVSAEVVINGSDLPERHSISNNDIPYEEYQLRQDVIRDIESQTNVRFMPNEKGFTHEIITKKITLK